MSDLPEIVSTLRITGRKGLGGVREVLESNNTAFTNGLAVWAGTCWTNGFGSYPYMCQIPWKHPAGKYANDTSIYCQQLYGSNYMTYPGWGNGSGAIGSSTSDRDVQRFMMRQSTVQSYNAAFIPHVIGSVGTTYNGAYNGYPYLFSVAEVPGTQIGNYFPHPLGPSGNLVSTTAAGSTFTNTNTPTWSSTLGGSNAIYLQYRPGIVDTLRITSGTDKGIYHIKRPVPGNPAGAVVTHIDGSTVSWLNTTTQATYFNNRMCYGNETGVIALSAGTVTFGGTFAPGASRNSYMVKIHYDKSGNTTAGTTQGSYWFSLRPYTHGANSDHEQFYFQSIMFGRHDVSPSSQGLSWTNQSSNARIWNNQTPGGIKSYALDTTNQRLWYAISDGTTNSGIGFWLYKTVENIHEVANTTATASGSAGLLSSPIQMASTMCYSVDAGTDGTIYAALYSASSSNAGLVVIAPDFTTTTYNNATGGCPGIKFTCAKVDKTKNRAGTDASFSGTNQFVSASGAFTTLDLGRVIKITGGANAGTYKISAINSGTNVTVVVPSTGAAVTWANNALTNQTWAIGDRIWCFFNDTSTNNGKLYYMESTLLGTWLSQTVTMTNGKQCAAVGDLAPGHGGCAAVDPKNSTLYWISTDTANQINQYVPGAATVTSIIGSDLGGKSGTDASMTIGGNTLNSATGNFSNGIDLNRTITITGGANAGTYKISTVNSTTQVVVTTTTGGAVSWPSSLTNQTWATGYKGRAGGVPAAGGFLTIGVNPIFNELWAGALDTSGGTGQGTYRFDTSVTFNAANWASDTAVLGVYFGNQQNYGASTLGWHLNESSSGFYDTAASFTFGPDGKTYATHWNARTQGAGRTMFGWYSREADGWQQMSGYSDVGNVGTYQTLAPAGTPTAGLWTVLWADPYGGIVWLNPQSSDGGIGNAPSLGFFGHLTVDYQWINSVWTPKETVRGPLPAKSISDNATYATGLKTKPLHSTADTLIYGVTIQFTQTAGTSYNDFVGRFACTLDNKSDGATTAGTATSATFTGSGFAAADVGRYLRLESGANAGVYKITAYTDANHITIAVLNGSSFTLSTLSSLNYSVWDAGDPTGASGVNGGPETGTIMLSNGFGKDNTQDVNGVQMDFATAKTILSDQTDSIKFAIDPPGVSGSATLQVYADLASSSNSGAWPRHRALGSLLSNIQQIDGLTDRALDNVNGRTSTSVNPTSNRDAYDGYHVTVDFGRDVEVGTVVARRGSAGWSDTTLYGYNTGGQMSGHLVELDVAPDGSAPVQSDTGASRTSGTGLYSGSGTEAAWTNQNTDFNGVYLRVTGGGNFMGSNDAGFPRSVGSITTGGNVLTDAGAGFSQSHVGHALNITAGSASDIGWYRIISVVNGTSITVAPLNNFRTGAVTSFVNTVSNGISYTVTNAVQDGDIIKATTGSKYMVVFSVEEPTTVFCYTSFQNASAIVNSAWTAYAPTWNLVKKAYNGTISIYYMPGTIGNKTFQAANSKFRGVQYDDPMDFFDLSDLTTAKRTGRWWRYACMQIPAWTRTNSANWSSGTFTTDQIEFYDTSGKNLITHAYNRVDTYDSNPNFMRANVTRVDWIQSTNSAGASGSNGLVDVSGTTATLHTGGNVFLGHHVRRSPSGGCTAAGGNNILTASANFFMSSDVGRIIYIPAGANVGYYKILAYSSATSVTLVTPNGSGVTLTADATQRIVDVYEGIATGDYLAITTGGVNNTNVEYQIASIANNLQTLTLSSGPTAAITSQNWEIRRRANLIGSTCWGTTLVSGTYTLSSGDFHHDSSGHFKTAAVDQTAYTTAVATAVFSAKTDGATTISTGTFNGSDFHQDDVGKVLMIQSGSDKGHYKISAFTSSTQVTVVNLYTGAAVSFAASAGSLSYIIKGDRRFRVSRYTSVVRA